jgi:hypothetical protein
MRAIRLTCLFSILLLAGCFKPERPATLASAESFAKSLVEQLRKSGAVEEWGGGSGQAGNVYTRDFSRLLPAEGFPPDRLYDAAMAALVQWGEYDTYSTRGSGGGSARFHLHYGGSRSHAFIDVFAYAERDKTRVDFLIRVVE